jgi:hypothetical protein
MGPPRGDEKQQDNSDGRQAEKLRRGGIATTVVGSGMNRLPPGARYMRTKLTTYETGVRTERAV